MRVVLVDDEESWADMYSRLAAARYVAFDTEATSLDWLSPNFKVVGISFAVDRTTGYYVPLNHRRKPQLTLFDMSDYSAPPPSIKQLPESFVLPRIKPILEQKPIIGHGLKFDMHAMSVYGIKLNIAYDTLSASHIIDERGRHGLKIVTEKYLGYKPILFGEVVGAKEKADRNVESGFDYVPILKAAPYAAADAVNVIRLRDLFRPQLQSNPKFMQLMALETTLTPEIAEAETIGTNLDTQHLVTMHLDLAAKISREDELIRNIARNQMLNPGSTQQMIDLVYNQMGVPFPGKRRDKNSNKGMLERATIEKMTVAIRTNDKATYGKKGSERWTKHDVMEMLEAYQRKERYDKLDSTYTTNMINKISADGRLHTQFNQHGARSGRLSSEQPNFQNLSRNTDPNDPVYGYDVRKAFRADPGWVYVLADYSTMEMRIAAAISGCEALSGILNGNIRDGRGDIIDIHLYTACKAFGLDYDQSAAIYADQHHPEYKKVKEYRQKAKPVNFGILYGMTEYGLAVSLHDTVEIARIVIAGFMAAYPGVAAWMQNVKYYLRQQLFTETFMGRRRRISYEETRNEDAFNKAYRACLNHIIQGTGADIVKLAWVKVARELRRRQLQAKVAMQIHDELVTHCPDEEYQEVGRLMVEQMHYVLNNITLPAEAEVKRTLSKLEEPLWKYAAHAA